MPCGVFKSLGFRLAAAVSVDLIAAYFAMSDVEPPEQPSGHFNEDAVYVMSEPAAPEGDEVTNAARGGRGRKGQKKNPFNQKPQQGDHWSDLQELRVKLAEHEEMLGKLRSAFAMISVTLDLRRPGTATTVYSSVDDSSSFLGEDAAHRPARLTRRGGANSFNTSHYKNNNRGGSANFNNNNNGGRYASNYNNNSNYTPLGNNNNCRRSGSFRG